MDCQEVLNLLTIHTLHFSDLLIYLRELVVSWKIILK